MKNLLFASAATAALLAGVGLASAQAPKGEHGQAPQRAQPAEHAAPAQNPAQNREAAPANRPETTGQAPAAPDNRARPEQRQDQQNGRANAPAAGDQREGQAPGVRDQREGQAPAARQQREGQAPGVREGARPGAPAETTGQGARTPGGFSTEQREKIRTTILHEGVRPETNVNFNMAVGTMIPRTVMLYALPAEIIVMEPAWRGYEFFLVTDEIVIVEPGTLRIVAVVPA